MASSSQSFDAQTQTARTKGFEEAWYPSYSQAENSALRTTAFVGMGDKSNLM